MLLIILESLILPLIISLVFAYITKKYFFTSIIFGIVFINKCLRTYFFLSSRNILSIIGSNFLNALFLMILLYLIMTFFEIEINIDKIHKESSHKKIIKIMILSTTSFTLLIGLVWIIGSINSNISVKQVYNSINSEVKQSNEAPTFKRGQTPVALTIGTVKNRMNKSMSDVPNPQYYDLGTIEAQYYKNKPVYIASLNYSGYFKSKQAKTIPGYFIIDATNINATPKFIKKQIKYSPSGYFNKNVIRMMYKKYPTWLVANNSEPQLEINDKGIPYFVQTMYKPAAMSHKINYNTLHVITMNAQTGKMKLYNLHNLPKWIDEGITLDVANSMNKAYGSYKNGWLNQLFFMPQTDVKSPTEDGAMTVFDKNGQINYFTDFTRAKSNSDSALGYSMINSHTGKLVFYSTKSIMDSEGAQKNANQNYKAQKWTASMPIIYNIDGHQTWVMSILDDTDAFRGYYYLDAANQSINASGNNANQALDNFRQSIVSNGGNVGNTKNTKNIKINGIVDRVVVLANNDHNNVLLTIQNDKTIYTINLNDYQNAALIKPGDNIKFSAKVANNKQVGNIESYENLTFK